MQRIRGDSRPVSGGVPALRIVDGGSRFLAICIWIAGLAGVTGLLGQDLVVSLEVAASMAVAIATGGLGFALWRRSLVVFENLVLIRGPLRDRWFGLDSVAEVVTLMPALGREPTLALLLRGSGDLVRCRAVTPRLFTSVYEGRARSVNREATGIDKVPRVVEPTREAHRRVKTALRWMGIGGLPLAVGTLWLDDLALTQRVGGGLLIATAAVVLLYASAHTGGKT